MTRGIFIILTLLLFLKVNAQNLQFGFENKEIALLLKEVNIKDKGDLVLIGISYYETIDPFINKLNDSILRYGIKPLIRKSKCKNQSSQQQDGEVIGVSNGVVFFEISRVWETDKYIITYNDKSFARARLNAFVKSMIAKNVDRGFMVFSTDIDKYFIKTNNDYFYYDYKSSQFEAVNR